MSTKQRKQVGNYVRRVGRDTDYPIRHIYCAVCKDWEMVREGWPSASDLICGRCSTILVTNRVSKPYIQV